MSIVLNIANVLGLLLLILGFLYLLTLLFKKVFSKHKEKSFFHKLVYRLLVILSGTLICYVVSLNSIELNNKNTINSSVDNPSAITMNLHQNAEVKYLYDNKYVSLSFDNSVPSFRIKAIPSKNIKIVTIQKYKNAFMVNTVETTETIIKYSD
ncbi:hypothetical protein [Apilactobacillus ozensis]|uniref:hypothetical protein n=1 Tax=Apilactobacillus ozensis TaxID=866801 RepID=UPI00070529D8|nr:hypothetical protein [Apilactobacillus ozensis]